MVNLKEVAKAKYGQSFLDKLQEIAIYLKFTPEWLLVIMYYESGISKDIVNGQSGATGLIQFMPATAQRLGTTTQALAKMTATQQLEYVRKYYEVIKGKAKQFSDVYLFNFAGAFVEPSQAPDNYILSQGDSASYHSKYGKDGILTVAEWRKEADDRYEEATGKRPTGQNADITTEIALFKKKVSEKFIKNIVIAIFTIIITYFTLKYFKII